MIMKYSLSRFIKNLKFLMKYNLNAEHDKLKLDILKSVEDIYYYEVLDKEKEKHRYMLDVLNYDKTKKMDVPDGSNHLRCSHCVVFLHQPGREQQTLGFLWHFDSFRSDCVRLGRSP